MARQSYCTGCGAIYDEADAGEHRMCRFGVAETVKPAAGPEKPAPGRARRDATGGVGTPVLVANEVANANPVTARVANRHGKYADPAKRRQYMRDLMRRRREAARA